MSQTSNLIHSSEYVIRTASTSRQLNLVRFRLLPAYPTHRMEERPPFLLLANVPTIDRELMELASYSGDYAPGHFDFCPFTLKIDPKHEFLPSFMIDFFRRLFVKTSQRLNIPFPLIDYNLVRLQKCFDRYSAQFNEASLISIDELSLAFEFYLQIDVDLFFMKTCDFKGATPRQEREGVLCQLAPTARYGMKRCRQNDCHLCTPEEKRSMVQFVEHQQHRFINGYEAILNCPTNCMTTNIIYALTCPCGEYDYIGSTRDSLYDRTLQHRQEGYRTICEFLIGPTTMKLIFDEDRRQIKKLINPYNEFLYHHSAKCSHGLQRFLDRNPHYWCFVPQRMADAEQEDKQYVAPSKSVSLAEATATATATGRPMLFASVLVDQYRKEDDARRLIRQLPPPPTGYRFSHRQCDEQRQFFIERKERRDAPADHVDLYKYTVVAVLPSHCSNQLRRFIESLFITHAESNLNLIGRLTYRYPYVEFDREHRGLWCSKLIRPIIL